jgi:hypothetical protein
VGIPSNRKIHTTGTGAERPRSEYRRAPSESQERPAHAFFGAFGGFVKGHRYGGARLKSGRNSVGAAAAARRFPYRCGWQRRENNNSRFAKMRFTP